MRDVWIPRKATNTLNPNCRSTMRRLSRLRPLRLASVAGGQCSRSSFLASAVVERRFSSMKKDILLKYQQRQPTPVSLRDMLAWSQMQHSAATSKLLTVELLTRLAHRIGELGEFPKSVQETAPVTKVMELYSSTFYSLANFYYSSSKWDDMMLTSLLRDFKDTDSATVPSIALGMHQVALSFPEQPPLPSDFQLNQFYQSRLGIRMLIGQRVRPRIKMTCVPSIVKRAYERAKKLSTEIHGSAPALQLNGHVDESVWPMSDTNGVFWYVPSHLEHILFELIKNSMGATIKMRELGKFEGDMPSIKVVISKGTDDVSLKVSDEGGGIARSVAPRIWSYKYSTAPSKILRKNHFKSLKHVAMATSENEDHEYVTFRENFSGGGYGLPIARVFARYFGGELEMATVDGFGTDVFLYIPNLNDATEVKP